MHYNTKGERGSDSFDIWVSRINPYGEAREQSSEKWKQQLENYDTDYLDEVKKLLLRWLDKACAQQQKTEPRPDKGLVTYADEYLTLRKEAFTISYFIRDLADMYNEVDVVRQYQSILYLQSIQQDYDWITYMGHGSPKGIHNGTSINDFNTPFVVNPRLFDLVACSTTRYVTLDWKSYDRTIGLAHLFRTLEGGAAVIGATKTTGGYQDEEYLYGLLKKGMLLGEAFREWANHRTLVFDQSRYPQEVYDWYYSHTLFGDPFIRFQTDKKNTHQDKFPKNIALHALNELVMYNSTCYDATQGKNARCNVVSESEEKEPLLRILGNVQVGSIYSKGGVHVYNTTVDNIFIYNTFQNADLYADSSTLYNMISYINPDRWDKSAGIQDSMKNFSTDSCPDITVDSSSIYQIKNGECINNLKVKGKGKIVLPMGEYDIGNLKMEENSYYEFEKPGYASIMHAREVNFASLKRPDSVDRETIAKGFKIYLHQKDRTSNFQNGFNGTIYAPGMYIKSSSEMYGSIMAGEIEVNANFHYVPFNPIGYAPDITTEIVHIKSPDNAGIRITAFNRNEIGFDAMTSGLYKITVMNVFGQEVASFKKDFMAGHNTINWNSSRLAKGRYIVSVTHQNVSNRKILLLK